MRRRPNTQSVQWFLELDASGQLDLEPAYQRRSVWNLDYQRFFIDTVLRDFPAPPIYLSVEQAPGAPTVYHVIDGKQRLEALVSFSKDMFHLGKYGEDLGLDPPDRYFSQLPERLQQQYIDYTLSVENISQASDEDLIEAFDRLNRNVAKLNAQELRNARYAGAFITRMENLVESNFWTLMGVATPARMRRMLDVEFVSELYVLTMAGPQDGKAMLDDFYALNDEIIENQSDTDQRFEAVLDWLKDIGDELRTTRYRNLGDLYGLWTALLELLDENRLPSPQVGLQRLVEFEALLDAHDRPAYASVYDDAVRQGTNKVANRMTRARSLAAVLVGEEPPSEPVSDDEAQAG